MAQEDMGSNMVLVTWHASLLIGPVLEQRHLAEHDVVSLLWQLVLDGAVLGAPQQVFVHQLVQLRLSVSALQLKFTSKGGTVGAIRCLQGKPRLSACLLCFQAYKLLSSCLTRIRIADGLPSMPVCHE